MTTTNDFVCLGYWVGCDERGYIRAGHAVYADVDEDEAKEFVSAGGLHPIRIGPDVAVRLGELFPEDQGEDQGLPTLEHYHSMEEYPEHSDRSGRGL